MIEQLNYFLDQYSLSPSDVCIVGSYALEVNNIRKAGDIDIVLRKKTRNRIGIPLSKAIKVNTSVEIVTYGWAEFMNINDDELINNNKYYEYHNGYKVVKLELVINKKNTIRRPKDLDDLELLGIDVTKLTNKNNDGFALFKHSLITKARYIHRKFTDALKYNLIKALKKENIR